LRYARRGQMHRQTDRQTYTLIAIVRPPTMGEVKLGVDSD